MPELPEVEAARRAIEDHCIGKMIIKSIIADDAKVIDGVSPKDFEASLSGRTIVAAHRKGKNMWLQLDSPPFPSFQFGMTGAVYIKGVAVTKYKRSTVKDTDEWPSKYSKLFIELNDGLELSFTDKRRLAKVRLLDNPLAVPPISELGPDALLEPMTVDEFYSSLSKKKIGIKALLLDQGFVSGIGNWIADEVLYQAKIHPMQIASSLSKESCRTLLNCINEVIGKAVEVGADSSQFPSNWIFHFRETKPGKAFVDGKKIEFITAGGRTTAYVPELQKLSGAQATKAAGKPMKGSAKRTKSNNGGNDADEQEGEEEAETRDIKAEIGKRTTRDKKASLKGNGKFIKRSKSVVHDDDNYNGSEDEDSKKSGGKKSSARNNSKGSYKKDNEGEKKRTTEKPTPRKRKAVESDDSAEDDARDEDDNNEHQEIAEETKMEKTSRKKVGSSQSRKPVKKKAK